MWPWLWVPRFAWRIFDGSELVYHEAREGHEGRKLKYDNFRILRDRRVLRCDRHLHEVIVCAYEESSSCRELIV